MQNYSQPETRLSQTVIFQFQSLHFVILGLRLYKPIPFLQWVPQQALPAGVLEKAWKDGEGTGFLLLAAVSLSVSLATRDLYPNSDSKLQFPALAPYFQKQPYYPPTITPPTSLCTHASRSWLCGAPPPSCCTSALASQCPLLKDLAPTSAGPSSRPSGFRPSTSFIHSTSPMDDSCFQCCYSCVTLVCPLSLFRSLIPIFLTPCIKFLIKITGGEPVPLDHD